MNAPPRIQLTHTDMDRLIDEHIRAEMASDPAGAIAVYTDDVEHDVVGFPTGPVHGREAARGFYEHLIKNITTDTMVVTRSYHGDNHCTMEHRWTGTVQGSFLGIPGHGKHISFRLLHVFEFKDGKISRENVWLDGGSIAAQLTGRAH